MDKEKADEIEKTLEWVLYNTVEENYFAEVKEIFKDLIKDLREN